MATTTACYAYSYDQVFGSRTLTEWVNIVHKYASIKSGWEYRPIQPGAFGFDNFAMSIGLIFSNKDSDIHDITNEENLESLSDIAHKGWAKNYVFWRDYKPFETNKAYKKPANALGDARRNKCSETPYVDLPEEEKEKDRIIIRAIKEFLEIRNHTFSD